MKEHINKTKFKPQFNRLLVIDNEIKSGQFPSKPYLAKLLEVSESTVKRDLDFMVQDLYAPLAYNSSKKGFYYTENTFNLPAFPISENELLSINLMRKMLVQFENTPVYSMIDNVFSKISGYLSEYGIDHRKWIDKNFTFFNEPVAAISQDVFNILFASFNQRKRIKIHYRPLSADTFMERMVDPYHILCYRGNWYLFGYCYYKESVRLFSLSRVKNPVLLDETFEIPESFNVNDFVDKTGVYATEKKFTIKILFNNEAAHYIEERIWQDGQKITRCDDGSIILEYVSGQLVENARWISSQGKNAKVLEPVELVDIVKAELEEALKRY